jgi:tryptophan synthase alpha chain
LADKRRAGRLEAALRADGELKLVPYLMAGFPDLGRSAEIARRLASSGAAAIEVGIPFSDPLADGPVIQQAGQAALRGGATVAGCLEVAAAAAAVGTAPVVLMTYVNPVLAYGTDRFAADAAAAGVAGVILPDLPAEEAVELGETLASEGLETVLLVAPTSSEARIEMIGRASRGFVYCVTVTGITGLRAELTHEVETLIARVRRHSSLPVAAGFGISRPEHLSALRGTADAAVVGSALVAEVAAGRDPAALVSELLTACR